MSQKAVTQPIPVGQYFLDRGKITQQQLDLALQHREEFNLKLGQSLVELGLVTEADMVEALRHQARFPCIHLTTGIVEGRVAHKLGESLSRRLRAIALNQIAGHTTVALEDPSDGPTLDELSHNLGTRIFPVYAEPSAIRRILDQVFGQRSVTKPRPAAPLPPPPTAGAVEIREPQPRAPVVAASFETGVAVDERAVVDKVRGFLQEAFAQSVTDIHIETRRHDLVVRFRVDGALREYARLPSNWSRPTLACLKALAKIDAAQTGPGQGTIPFTFLQQNLEVRMATIASLHGESAVLHVVRGRDGHRSLTDLGLTDEQRAQLEDVASMRAGLVLVAGPGGSGRTTTLLALIERFVGDHRKIVALERKVEHEVEGVLHVELDAAAGASHAAGARALMRQDPDVMLLGEIDGKETAQAALEIARSGRTVLAAVHAQGALEALSGLLHLGLEPYLLADAVRAVVAQRVVRRICGDCKAAIVPDEVLRARLDLPRDATYHEGEGCLACHSSGFSGRIGLFEVLEMTPALRRELEKGADPEALARVARDGRFTTLREHGLRQARTGLTTLHEVLAATGRG